MAYKLYTVLCTGTDLKRKFNLKTKMMDLKGFFDLNKNEEREQWEFTPNEKVNSTSYTVAFYEADNEEDAWITLFMAVQKSPEFRIKETA